MGGAGLLVAAAKGAAGAAPKRFPAVGAAAGAALLAAGCDDVVAVPPNIGSAEGVVVAAVPGCEVPAVAAAPLRLEKRFAVGAVVLGAAEVFCCPPKTLEL